jgi:superfamily II DNA helicase RecQ
VVNQAQMIERSESSDDRKRVERRKLDQLLGFCESVRCRRQVLLEGFGEVYPKPCGNCDNCLEPADTWDGSVAVQKALSCIYRTGQRFGVVHLIDVLRGRQAAASHGPPRRSVRASELDGRAGCRRRRQQPGLPASSSDWTPPPPIASPVCGSGASPTSRARRACRPT